MSQLMSVTPPRRGRQQLAASIASLFALSLPASAFAATSWIVNSCDGELVSGVGNSGTLRYALLNATSGDTIELGGLTGLNACTGSKISLLTGSLSATQNQLTLHGPGFSSLTLDASSIPIIPSSANRVLTHTGTGTLTIDGLKLKGGYVNYYISPAYGGCLYSKGDVYLKNAYVTGCRAYGRYNTAVGGGVFAIGYVRLTHSYVLASNAVGIDGTAKGGGVASKSNVYLSSSEVAGSAAKSGTATKAGGAVYGGGIYAAGKLGTVGAFITGNTAYSNGAEATGGGAFAAGDTSLQLSLVSGNKVQPGSGHNSRGGGVRTPGNFYSNYSTISNNRAEGSAFGGGLNLSGVLSTIKTTTISGNFSANAAGGVESFYGVGLTLGSATLVLNNSTISGNSATNQDGGIYSDAATMKFYSSTIAFNTAGTSKPGAVIGVGLHGVSLTLFDTLMSNNTAGSSEDDLDLTSPFAVTVNGGNPNTNAYNLVRARSLQITLPNDTKTGCPLLGKLRYNGGLTQTHALLSHSVAIDAGAASPGAAYDERGPQVVNGERNYLRISGQTGRSDIGAYEVQQDDIVFNADFEGCPLLF